MNLPLMKDFMETISYNAFSSKESSGIFGNSSYSFTAQNYNYLIRAIFDVSENKVYSIIAIDYSKKKGFIWIHPDYVDVYFRFIDDEFNLDDISYIQTDYVPDILDKVKKIYTNEEYNDLVSLPLDVSERELFYAMKQANKLDMTFNQYLNMLIEVSLVRNS